MRIKSLSGQNGDFHVSRVTAKRSERERGHIGTPANTVRRTSAFLYVVSGGFELLGGDGEVRHRMSAGELLYVPQGDRCGSVYTGERNVSIGIFCQFNDSLGSFALSESALKLRGDRLGGFKAIFDPLDYPGYLPSENGIYESELLFRLLGLIKNDFDTGGAETHGGMFSEGLRLLGEDLSRDMPISEMAVRMNISEGYFRRLCRQTTGFSPVVYRNRLRVSKARELLLSGSYNTTEVAEAVGITNSSYFSKLYKRMYGETTLELRRRLKETLI